MDAHTILAVWMKRLWTAVLLLMLTFTVLSVPASTGAPTSRCHASDHGVEQHSHHSLQLPHRHITYPSPQILGLHHRPTASTPAIVIAKDDALKRVKKGTFLVATDNLTGSSFSETVILITHYSNWGATGLAINRPAEITLDEAFPNMEQLHDNRDKLYLGGPVKPETIFVLLQTKSPHDGMRNIADDLYFAPGFMAFSHDTPEKEDESGEVEHARAFAGYSGWAPGQLEAEIRRGDWLVIESDLDIIFTEEHQSLWKKLLHDWSGTWI